LIAQTKEGGNIRKKDENWKAIPQFFFANIKEALIDGLLKKIIYQTFFNTKKIPLKKIRPTNLSKRLKTIWTWVKKILQA
jgi:hypothetical protein